MSWIYGEEWRVGYEVWKDKKNNKDIHGPLRYRVITENNMGNPRIELLGLDKTCPWDIGIDLVVTPEIGVALYVLLQAYVQVKCPCSG